MFLKPGLEELWGTGRHGLRKARTLQLRPLETVSFIRRWTEFRAICPVNRQHMPLANSIRGPRRNLLSRFHGGYLVSVPLYMWATCVLSLSQATVRILPIRASLQLWCTRLPRCSRRLVRIGLEHHVNPASSSTAHRRAHKSDNV